MNPFNANEFHSRLNTALGRIGLLLSHDEPSPKFAGDVSHQYEDKFKLADFLGNCIEVSVIDCLAKLGLSQAQFSSLQEQAKTRSISLRLALQENVDFSKTIEREVRSDVTNVRSSPITNAPKKSQLLLRFPKARFLAPMSHILSRKSSITFGTTLLLTN